MVIDTKKYIDTAIKAAKKAGEIIINNLGFMIKEDIEVKSVSDYVTRVDKEAEEIVIDIIKKAFPEHCFLAEESAQKAKTGDYCWLIDPLDGTTNYIHGFPVFCVSIALQYQGKIVLGVIFDPVKNELFTAEKGKGAFLNNLKLQVCHLDSLEHSLLATGFPFRSKELLDEYLTLFKNLFFKVSGIRRAGSAALDLAYVACGRVDGFFELGLNPWDVAAGSIIISEAGGIVSDFRGTEDYLLSGNILAGSSETIHRELLNESVKVFKGII